jgi:hypothetical protein
MHEVGSEFALGMRPVPRLPDGLVNGPTHRRIDDSCNDFGPQAPFSQRARQRRRARFTCLVRSGSVCPGFHPPAGALIRAAMAPPHRGTLVRFFMRYARGNAHDLALASGMVRQPAPRTVSRASITDRERLRSRLSHRLGSAQRVDWILGGDSISRRVKVAGR